MSKIILSTALFLGFYIVSSLSLQACPCNSIDIEVDKTSWLKSNKFTSQNNEESFVNESN